MKFMPTEQFDLQNKAGHGTRSEDSWFTAGRFVLALGLLVFVTFPRVLLGSQTFVFRDYGLFSYPVAFFHRQCFWRGELPLWNPFNHCGMPFLAQWNTLTLYPGSLIYLLLPLPWSLSFFCLAHLFWGGLGMYFLTRHWTNHPLAAAVGGVVFSFNGLMLNFLMWPSHVATLGWLPWVLWLVPAAWRAGGRTLAFATLAATMQVLAGGPETILFTWCVLVLLACGDCMGTREPNKEGESPSERLWLGFWSSRGRSPSQVSHWQIALRLAGMVLLVAMLCSAQLLPFLELLRHSERHANFATVSYNWTMPLWGWANYLVPMFRMHKGTQGVFLQSSQNWTSSYYAGIATLWLAAIAVRNARNWRALVLSVLVLAGMVLALGDGGFLYRGLRYLIPALGFVRYPVKFVILASALIPLLAALGFAALLPNARVGRNSGPASPGGSDTIPTAPSMRRHLVGTLCASLGLTAMALAALILLGLASLAAFAWAYRYPGEVWELTCRNAAARGGLLLLMVLLCVALAKARGGFRIVCGSILLTLFWFDLVTHVPTQNPTASPSVYSPGWAREQLTWDSPARLGRGRVMLSALAAKILTLNSLPDIEADYRTKRLAYFCDCNLLDDVPQIHGFFSLFPGRTSALTSLPYAQTNQDFSTLLDFMAVNEVTAPGKLAGWAPRSTAMPIVTIGQAPVFADDQTAIEGLLRTNADLRDTVFLPPEARQVVRATGHPEAQVKCHQFTNHKVVIETRSPGPSVVVISQSWYPAWRAYVDGEPTKLWRANYGFQALQVPAGNHLVQLRYLDRVFLAGATLSALGVIACIPLCRRSRPRSEEPGPASSSR